MGVGARPEVVGPIGDEEEVTAAGAGPVVEVRFQGMVDVATAHEGTGGAFEPGGAGGGDGGPLVVTGEAFSGAGDVGGSLGAFLLQGEEVILGRIGHGLEMGPAGCSRVVLLKQRIDNEKWRGSGPRIVVGRHTLEVWPRVEGGVFPEHEGMVEGDLTLAFGGFEIGSWVVEVDTGDGVMEEEVHASSPQAEEEVVVVVPEAFGELRVIAADGFDLFRRAAPDEAHGAGMGGISEEVPGRGAIPVDLGSLGPAGALTAAVYHRLQIRRQTTRPYDIHLRLDDVAAEAVEQVPGGFRDGAVPAGDRGGPATLPFDLHESASFNQIIEPKRSSFGIGFRPIQDNDDFRGGLGVPRQRQRARDRLDDVLAAVVQCQQDGGFHRTRPPSWPGFISRTHSMA